MPSTMVAAQARQAELDPDILKRAIRAVFSAPGYRPPVMPGAAMELMQLATQPTVNFEEVLALLERDPVLTGKVLSIAQSALYAGRAPIRSLRQALIRLGVSTLRDLVVEASLHLRVFQVSGYKAPMKLLGRHSTAVAHVVRLVCGRTTVNAEYAFLCGLLHDVGFVASLLALSGSPRWREAPFEAVVPALNEIHEEASRMLAKLWQLPEPIQNVLGTHHRVTVDGVAEPVTAALVVAEQLAWEAGCGNVPPPAGAGPTIAAKLEPPAEGLDVSGPGALEEAQRVLRIDEVALGALRAETWELLRKVGLLPAALDG